MKKYFLLLLLCGTCIHSYVFAAHMYIEAPETASSNRSQFVVSVYLNPDGDVVSGLAGDLSFPSEMFVVKSITMQSGFVSMWLTSPHVSLDKTLDSRTHITFEGIIPGGFSGVRSPYFAGEGRGVVFTVILIPKESGRDIFRLDNVEVRAFDKDATLLTNKGDIHPVYVPTQTGKLEVISDESTLISNEDISITVNKSELINNDSNYIFIHNANPNRSIDHILVAESNEYNPAYISNSKWHNADNPYTLINQSRTRYIHAKIIFADGTFAYKTLPPVENSSHITQLSRILVYILIAVSLLYHYAKHFTYLFSRSFRKKK